MKNKFFFSIALLVFFAPFFLQGQEETAQTGTSAAVRAAEGADTVYVIREIEFDIKGRSKPYALITNGGFKYGERINGRDSFEKYLADKQQLLLNQRVLEDSSIEYFLGGAEEDGALPVKLLVHATDTWNFVILPYPKYDSNDGLSLTLKMRDYNFLGSMSALRVDLGYRSKDDDNIVSLTIDSDIPFQAAGHNWVFNFDHIFSYTFGQPLYYQNVTGISVDLPWDTTTLNVGVNQYLTVNEKNSQDSIDLYGLDERYNGLYASSEVFASYRIPFGVEVGNFGEIAYTPGVSGKVNYPYGKMDEPRRPVTTFSHTLGFGRINWVGNYRKGMSVSLRNSYSWFFDRSDAPLSISMDAGATFHWPFNKIIGVSGRAKYRQWWQWSDRGNDWIPYYSAGDVIRGVIDDQIRATLMFSLNLELPIRVLRFWPSEWFGNPKLHFFDFEMHFSPFVDVAMLKGPYSKLKEDPYEGTRFRPGDMIYTGGLEVIVFPGFFRSFYLRGSIGYNVKEVRREGITKKWGFFPQWNEIYIGVDHYY